MNRFSKLVTAFAVLPLFAVTGSALADSPGQLEGGTGTYLVKNLTQGGSYAPAINANACDEVQYSIRLHNVAYGGLTAVNVKVNVPSNSATSNTSTMTATTNLGGISGTNGSATVNLSSAQSISYENGTATLFDGNGNAIKTLPDTITGNGVNIGGLNGSTTEFVNFKAKVSCPEVPKHEFVCKGADVKQVDRTHFDFTAYAEVQNATVNSYVFTVKDANGKAVDTKTVNTSALSAVYHFNQSNVGTYTITAVIHTNQGTTEVGKCEASVVVKSTPPVTPPQVLQATTMPNTGPGDVIGLFAGASAVGTAGHYIVSRRRRS
jgi:hypothetical protein